MEVLLVGREPDPNETSPINSRPVFKMPSIPNDSDELLERLYDTSSPDNKYLPSVVCQRCEQVLPLQDLHAVDWRVGDNNFYFGPVPGYECQPCGENYFPRRVVIGVIESINRANLKDNLGPLIPMIPLPDSVRLAD